MEQIEAGFLDKERDNIGIRAILRNIEDYALSARLESIKTAIDQLKSNPSALSKPESASEPTIAPPTPSSMLLDTSSFSSSLDPALTALPVASQAPPPAKRARTDDGTL